MLRFSAIVSFFAMYLGIPAAYANLVIVATFDSSIASGSNATVIESVINSAIQFYESAFTNNIVVPITFQSSTSGLGGSTFNLYDIPYASFSSALYNNAQITQNANQLAASAANPVSAHNPVTHTSDVLMKCANIDALFGQGSSGCSSDGTITLNTSLTNPGTLSSSDVYSLSAVVEHEIDEILGLGSSLGLGLGAYSCGNPSTSCSNVPTPEDLFRYTAAGARSFTTSSTNAFFSINGTTDIAQFNNANNGADYGDWQSNPLPSGVSPQVQDAFGSPYSSPTLGTAELTALNVIGYNLAVPEPMSAAILASGLIGLIASRRRRSVN